LTHRDAARTVIARVQHSLNTPAGLSCEVNMTRRQSVRTDLLDWWQAVLDETKELVDDNIDRLRGRAETRREAEVDELR
jgi:hypothetical protein